MAGRRLVVTTCVVVIWTALAQTSLALPKDAKVLPPVFRSFTSDNKSFVLDIQGSAGWRSPYATAELFSVGRSGRVRIWSQKLPHRFGPSTALISDSGRVLLINEGMNTPSPRSLTLLDESGAEIARYSIQEIGAIAKVSVSEMLHSARSLMWMSAPVRPLWKRGIIEFEVAGVPLNLNLASGELSRVRQ